MEGKPAKPDAGGHTAEEPVSGCPIEPSGPVLCAFRLASRSCCTPQEDLIREGTEFWETETPQPSEGGAYVPVKIHAMPMSMHCVGPIMLANVAECGGLEMCNRCHSTVS